MTAGNGSFDQTQGFVDPPGSGSLKTRHLESMGGNDNTPHLLVGGSRKDRDSYKKWLADLPADTSAGRCCP